MPKQYPNSPEAMWADGSPVLLRLERARLCEPHNPSLTDPEWELLEAFGLSTMAAVRQRLHERAMLAAYDGAPGALTEIRNARLPVSPERERAPSRERAYAQARFEEGLETRLDFDPEKERATIRYTVTRRRRGQEAIAGPQEAPERLFYAVTFDVREGGVILRECGTVHRSAGQLSVQDDVVREFVPQLAR